jgi:hypothetical protein
MNYQNLSFLNMYESRGVNTREVNQTIPPGQYFLRKKELKMLIEHL